MIFKNLIDKFTLSKTNDLNDKVQEEVGQDNCEDLTRPTFEQLIKFYKDNKQTEFPIDFNHKDEYFQKGCMVYDAIIKDDYVKEIKILNALDCAGLTEVNIKDNKVEIIISIASINLGIGTGGGVQEFTTKQCEIFADVLAHELFHAKNNMDIINYVGVEEYKSIRYCDNLWTKFAWNIFDEYCACRINAEQFKSFESVESVYGIERILSWVQANQKCKNQLDIPMIQQLLYAIATISAFVDVSKEKEERVLKELNKSKQLFEEVRKLFNSYYLEAPLNKERYDIMGHKLEEIYNSYVLLCKTI